MMDGYPLNEKKRKVSPGRNIQQWIAKTINFIATDIWRLRLEDLSFGKAFFLRQFRIVLLTLRGFYSDRCFLRASSLTFYTLLSIVPVMAMLFGIAKGFGFEKMLEKDLVKQFPGQEEVLNQVISFAQSLLETTKGGVIAGIGVVILLWTVVKVLSHIEAALNEIWDIKEHRSWSRKFSDYLAVMLISPLLILVSGSATVFITTRITEITTKVKLLGLISPLIFLGLKFIPYILIWVLFTLIYILMPNTKVNLRSGMIAGIIAGSIYQVAQMGYIRFQVGTSQYNAIYGSFAALPLFLMWVQISWWIVLLGAELSFAHQNVDTYQNEPDFQEISPAFKKLLTLQVAHLLIQNFSKGEKPFIDSWISRRLKIPIRLLHQILQDLVESGIFIETKTREEKRFGYQPARDISGITISCILEAIDHRGSETLPVARTAELAVLSNALQTFSELIRNSPANRPLKEI